jgi:26S proteasome regulatory subunit N1
MAKDGEPAKSVDKGKGKSVETDPSKSEEPKKDKDGKPLANGTKEEGLIGGEELVSR